MQHPAIQVQLPQLFAHGIQISGEIGIQELAAFNHPKWCRNGALIGGFIQQMLFKHQPQHQIAALLRTLWKAARVIETRTFDDTDQQGVLFRI